MTEFFRFVANSKAAPDGSPNDEYHELPEGKSIGNLAIGMHLNGLDPAATVGSQFLRVMITLTSKGRKYGSIALIDDILTPSKTSILSKVCPAPLPKGAMLLSRVYAPTGSDKSVIHIHGTVTDK